METIWRLDGAYSGNDAVTLKYQITAHVYAHVLLQIFHYQLPNQKSHSIHMLSIQIDTKSLEYTHPSIK